MCRQQSPSQYRDVHDDLRESFHLNYHVDQEKMVATILADSRKDAQAPQVC